MSGGGGDQETTQENVPWEGVQPYMKDIFARAQNAYNAGQLGALGGTSGITNLARGLTAGRALTGGTGLNPAAVGMTGETLAGDYLSGNPYMQEAIEYAQQPVIDAFNEQVAPGIDATFSGSGRLGSGAYAAARNRAEDTLARNLAGAATSAGYQNYGDERARQMQAAALAPGLEQAGYYGIDRLGGLGGALDARSQQFAQQPGQAIREYASIVNSVPYAGYGTTTTQQPGQGFDPFSTGLGALGLMGGLGGIF